VSDDCVVQLVQPDDPGPCCRKCHWYYPCQDQSCGFTGVDHGFCYCETRYESNYADRPACRHYKPRKEEEEDTSVHES